MVSPVKHIHGVSHFKRYLLESIHFSDGFPDTNPFRQRPRRGQRGGGVFYGHPPYLQSPLCKRLPGYINPLLELRLPEVPGGLLYSGAASTHCDCMAETR